MINILVQKYSVEKIIMYVPIKQNNKTTIITRYPRLVLFSLCLIRDDLNAVPE
jgi:hypothetical protein